MCVVVDVKSGHIFSDGKMDFHVHSCQRNATEKTWLSSSSANDTVKACIEIESVLVKKSTKINLRYMRPAINQDFTPFSATKHCEEIISSMHFDS